MKQCTSLNPETNNVCTMAEDHFGSHRVGNVYHPSETWVTKCVDRDCDYHPDGSGSELCIYCGDARPMQEVPCPGCGKPVMVSADWDDQDPDAALCEPCQDEED